MRIWNRVAGFDKNAVQEKYRFFLSAVSANESVVGLGWHKVPGYDEPIYLAIMIAWYKFYLVGNKNEISPRRPPYWKTLDEAAFPHENDGKWQIEDGIILLALEKIPELVKKVVAIERRKGRISLDVLEKAEKIADSSIQHLDKE
jgi:hypothetical protein